MIRQLLSRLQELHVGVPPALHACYVEKHEILGRAKYSNPWLVSLEEASRVLDEAAFARYQEITAEVEKLKQKVWDEVVATFLELKECVEWYRHRPYPEGSSGDHYMRHYRAEIADGYELQLCWNNMPTDPANSIDLRIKGILRIPQTERKEYRILGVTVWTTTKRWSYEEWFPDFGPVIAGPKEEGSFSRDLEKEASRVSPCTRDAIYALYIELRERFG